MAARVLYYKLRKPHLGVVKGNILDVATEKDGSIRGFNVRDRGWFSASECSDSEISYINSEYERRYLPPKKGIEALR